MQHLIQGVEALYPRIDQPYKWSQEQSRSVPCEWNEKGASRTMKIVVGYEQAVKLRKAMAEAYKEKAKDGWPKFKDNFELVEGSIKGKDAVFHIKTQLACFDAKTRVRQFDASNNPLPDDFQLTTGSTINVQITLVPYSSDRGNGTSLRLSAVQVLKLVAMKTSSPFDKVDGYTATDASPFTENAIEAEPEGEDWDGEEAEVEEPKKAAPKKAVPEVKDDDDDDDLNAIIDEWGDD